VCRFYCFCKSSIFLVNKKDVEKKMLLYERGQKIIVPFLISFEYSTIPITANMGVFIRYAASIFALSKTDNY